MQPFVVLIILAGLVVATSWILRGARRRATLRNIPRLRLPDAKNEKTTSPPRSFYPAPNEGPRLGFAIVSNDEAGVSPYPYIYVNADGTARELHEDERKFLETLFHPGDGARPWVKENYLQKNGWGEIKGFLNRSKLPPGTGISPASTYNPNRPLTKEEQIKFRRGNGLEVVEQSNSNITVTKPRA